MGLESRHMCIKYYIIHDGIKLVTLQQRFIEEFCVANSQIGVLKHGPSFGFCHRFCLKGGEKFYKLDSCPNGKSDEDKQSKADD